MHVYKNACNLRICVWSINTMVKFKKTHKIKHTHTHTHTSIVIVSADFLWDPPRKVPDATNLTTAFASLNISYSAQVSLELELAYPLISSGLTRNTCSIFFFSQNWVPLLICSEYKADTPSSCLKGLSVTGSANFPESFWQIWVGASHSPMRGPLHLLMPLLKSKKENLTVTGSHCYLPSGDALFLVQCPELRLS